MGNQSSTAAAEEWKSDARRAMENGTYCVICGSPFDIEGEIYNIDAKDSRFRVCSSKLHTQLAFVLY